MPRSGRKSSTSAAAALPKLPSLPKRPTPKSPIKPLPRLKPLPKMKSFPGTSQDRRPKQAGPDDLTIVATIRQALRERLSITAVYNDKHRQLSPLALGMKDGAFRLWAFQFGGESDHICKCFMVGNLSDVTIGHEPWQPPADDRGPLACMDEIEDSITSDG